MARHSIQGFINGFIVNPRRMEENSGIKVGDCVADDFADAFASDPPMGRIAFDIIERYDADFHIIAKGLLEQKTRATSMRAEGCDIDGPDGDTLLVEPLFGGQSRVVDSIFPCHGPEDGADAILRNAVLDKEINHVIARKAFRCIFVGGVANRAKNQDFLKMAGAEDIGDLFGGGSWRPALENEQGGAQGLVGARKE